MIVNHRLAKTMLDRPSPQGGAVLIISQLILVALTLIGITAAGVAGMEEKMAGNERDRHVAFQSAEAALRGAEAAIDDLASVAGFDGTGGRYPAGSRLDVAPDSPIWAGSGSAVYTGARLPPAKTPPRYVIQVLAARPGRSRGGGDGDGDGRGDGRTDRRSDGSEGHGGGDLDSGTAAGTVGADQIVELRITARGTGLSDKTVVILQSYYGKLLHGAAGDAGGVGNAAAAAGTGRLSWRQREF